ncbi:MAG: insulinase family protein [Gemmatimonadota bacterium]
MTKLALAALPLLPLLLAGCSDLGAIGNRRGSALPGHSRPVLEHDWPHPDELSFDDGGFRATDPASALFTSPAGVRAYIINDASDPLVRITAALPLGRNTEDGPGAADAAADVLRRTLADRLGGDFVGDVAVSGQAGVTTLTVETFAEDWQRVLTAVLATLREPQLDDVAAARTGNDATDGAAGAIARLTRLTARYPGAPPEPGSAVDAAAVRRTALRALDPHAVVIGVAGGLARADAEAAIVAATAGWTGIAAAQPSSRAPTIDATLLPAEALHTVDVPGELSWVVVGQTMPAIAPQDEAAVAALEEIINIRLNIVTREMRGLTNRAMLVLPEPLDGAGLLYVRTSSRAESVAPLIRLAVEELTRIRGTAGTPTAEELDQVKGGLVRGLWQRGLDGPRATAATYAMETARRGSLDALLGWPAAVNSVTAADVTAAAIMYIDPAKLTAVVVGPIDAVRAARHPRWPAGLEDMPALLR